MTPQDLKNSILQLAIQGKLVPQIESEGNAEDLYREIQKEKQKLIAEKKIKKEKPLEPIKEEDIPFDIPSSWKWVRWGELSQSIQYGYNASAQQSGRIRFVRISDIQDNEVIWDTVPYCDISEEEIPDYLLKENDILFARTGGTVGKSFLVKTLPYDAIYAGYLIRTRYSSLLVSQYLKFFMESDLYWRQLHNGVIATAQPNCNGKTLGNMIVPLPPIEEQKRIVAKIEELLPLVERYGKAYERIEEFNKKFPGDMKKSILQMAIQGKLVEQRPEEGTAEELYELIQTEKSRLIKEGKIKKEKPLEPIKEEEIPFEIPSSWKWVRLSNVLSVLNGDRGKNYPAKSTLSRKGIPFISAINLDGRKVIEDDNLLCLTDDQYKALNNGKLEKDDIVVCIRGSLGKHCQYQFDLGAIASSLVILRLFTNRDILGAYLMYYLDAPLFFTEIRRYDNGTAQPNLSANNLEKFLFPLPPLEEQKRIVAKIEEVLPLCDALIK